VHRKAQSRPGASLAHNEVATQVFCGRSVAHAAKVTDTAPAGSDATAAPTISLFRPAPAIWVGTTTGVGDAVGVRVGELFESPSPHPIPIAPQIPSTAKRVRSSLVLRLCSAPRRFTAVGALGRISRVKASSTA